MTRKSDSKKAAAKDNRKASTTGKSGTAKTPEKSEARPAQKPESATRGKSLSAGNAKAAPGDKAASARHAKSAQESSRPAAKAPARPAQTVESRSGKKNEVQNRARSAGKRAAAEAAKEAAQGSGTAANKAAARASRAGAVSRSAAQPAAGVATGAGAQLEELSMALIRPGSSPDRPLRAKSFLQFETRRPFGFSDHVPDIPGEYHQDKLVLMPKDPEWMFSYWELTPDLLERKATEKANGGAYREAMKINWKARDLFDTNFTFIPVSFRERRWWFKVPSSGQTYQVELGWLSDRGHFISVITSEPTDVPETWDETRSRLEGREVLNYNTRSFTLGSSEHVIVEERARLGELWNLSSEALGSSSRPAEGAAADWTGRREAGEPSELEIRGKVRPGTSVRIDGRDVATDGEGRFHLQLPLEKSSVQMTLTSQSGNAESFLYNLKELTVC